MCVTYQYHRVFWQCLWHIYIIKYSDNVCDISTSSSFLTMSVTYLCYQQLSVSYTKFVSFIQFAIVKAPTQPRDFLPRHWGSIERQVQRQKWDSLYLHATKMAMVILCQKKLILTLCDCVLIKILTLCDCVIISSLTLCDWVLIPFFLHSFSTFFFLHRGLWQGSWPDMSQTLSENGMIHDTGIQFAWYVTHIVRKFEKVVDLICHGHCQKLDCQKIGS